MALKSKRARKNFSVAVIAIDKETGNVYFGYNGGIKVSGEVKHQKLLGILPRQSLNDYKFVLNCAESHAIN